MYGFGSLPISLPKSSTNVLPAPVSCSDGIPGCVMNMPSEAGPAVLTVASSIGVNPSGANSVTSGPKPARRSLISLPPLLQMMPPRKTASAPDALILVAIAS